MRYFLEQKKWLIWSTPCALAVCVFAIYYSYISWKTLSIVDLTVPECDLRTKPCSVKLPSGEDIELQITPTHMPVLTSVQLKVKADKIPVKKIYINFKGAEMDMGEFRYDLTRQKEGSFSTQTILPTCIHEHMIWHAVVYIETPNKRYSAPFLFINQRPTSA